MTLSQYCRICFVILPLEFAINFRMYLFSSVRLQSQCLADHIAPASGLLALQPGPTTEHSSALGINWVWYPSCLPIYGPEHYTFSRLCCLQKEKKSHRCFFLCGYAKYSNLSFIWKEYPCISILLSTNFSKSHKFHLPGSGAHVLSRPLAY